LFVCFELHEQFFSYLVTVAIAGDRAANLVLFVCTTFHHPSLSWIHSQTQVLCLYYLSSSISRLDSLSDISSLIVCITFHHPSLCWIHSQTSVDTSSVCTTFHHPSLCWIHSQTKCRHKFSDCLYYFSSSISTGFTLRQVSTQVLCLYYLSSSISKLDSLSDTSSLFVLPFIIHL
jgi:hypothetical protein